MPDIDYSLAALVLVLGATAFWSYRAFKVDLPANLTPFGLIWGAGVVLGVIALVQGTESSGSAITAVILGGMLLFFLLAGGQKADSNPIKVGDKIPEFSAPDDSGGTFESSSLAGSAVVLKVFRGHW